MCKEKDFEPRELRDFFQSIGTVAAGTKIFTDGYRYVDDASFWKWMHDTVVKRDGLFDSAEAIRNFVTNKPKGSEILIQGRGMEWDWVRDFNNNPLNIGRSAKLASITDDRNGIDAFVNHLFGTPEKIQLKTAMSDVGARVNLSNYENMRVCVNERIVKWRESNPDILAQRGDHASVEQAYTDDQLAQTTRRRVDQAKAGQANPGITSQGVFYQIGKGAIIGAVINVGISSVAHYSEYKNGIISGNEYANILIKDSAKGGLTGGSMAAVNIPIQIAAKAIGVGFPVTIPVMIIVSYGLKQIIDPMFGEGKYKEILVEMNYTDDLTKGIAAFSYISTAAFEMQKHFIREIHKLGQRAHIINQYDQSTDQVLDKAIGEI